MEIFYSTDWVPDLPAELGLECLTRLPYDSHRVAAGVCRKWRDLLQSPEFYHHRRRLGFTRHVACLVQALPAPTLPDGTKSAGAGSPSYGITLFDPVSGSWERLAPVPRPARLPVFCQVAGCEGKLVVMGGWDPQSYDPVSDVFVYDFTTREWRVGAPMPSKRSFFAAAAVDGRVYVAGGHDEGKNALRSAWAYDLRRDEWAELPQLSQERDECEGLAVAGGEFWVVGGYPTERQGAFEGSAEVYDPSAAKWRRIDSAWEPSRCPRSCAVAASDGRQRLASWAESIPEVRAGVCGVALGESALLSGSEYQGAPQGVYFGGQNGKFEKISVPEEFSGFVQSGCCVEI